MFCLGVAQFLMELGIPRSWESLSFKCLSAIKNWAKNFFPQARGDAFGSAESYMSLGKGWFRSQCLFLCYAFTTGVFWCVWGHCSSFLGLQEHISEQVLFSHGIFVVLATGLDNWQKIFLIFPLNKEVAALLLTSFLCWSQSRVSR